MQSVKFQPVASMLHRPNFTFFLGSSTSKKRPSYVPWKDILTARCVWAIILVHGASVFGYFLVVNQLPGYMKEILKYDIKSNGLLSSLPYFGKYTMSVCASHFADHLRSTGKISTTVARKGFTTFAVAPPGIMFILLIFFGYDKVWAVTIFTIALTLNGAVTAGYLGNGLDIGPNFSGTIFGMANTLSSLGGFISAWMVGQLTENNVSFNSKIDLTLKLIVYNLFLEHLRSMANHFRNCGCHLSFRKFGFLNNGIR
jgi:MFS transporter, ACS family, solute carrier family 17 (sodium-dependent inorganic phosphate cotransporter), other